jgi:hypothetical protein
VVPAKGGDRFPVAANPRAALGHGARGGNTETPAVRDYGCAGATEIKSFDII